MAASALASQLQAIALSHTGQSSRNLPKGRPSLLFDPQEAANIDLQTIHRIGNQGLAELCNLDVRFEPFRDTLFGYVGASYDREMQTKEANEKLNTSITTFLRLLSNYLLLPPAHHALEFLIRRYLVQQYNVESVLLAALPYHETQLFVRLVQLLDLARMPRWRFLVGRVQQAGASLPRDALVQICSRDLGVLEAICTAAQQVSDAKQASKPLLSFSAVIVMEVLAAVTAVSDELVRRILPYILDGFKKDAAVEYQAGVLMIAAQLSTRITLSESLLSSLLRALVGSPPASLRSESLMVIIQIFQTQRPLIIPPKALKPLVKFPHLVNLLVELTARFDTAPFLRPFLRALVSSAQNEELLVQIVEKVPISGGVGGLVKELLKAAGFGGEESKEGKAFAQRVLRILDKRYSVELDASVNELLKGSAPSEESDGDEGAPATRKNALFDFVQETFSGGLHAPLAESGASLYLSVDHPQAEVRRLALERLGVLLGERAEGNEQLRTFMASAVLCRLADDDPTVVEAALSVPLLVKIAAREPLFEVLSSILVKSVGILEGSLELPIDSRAAVAMAKNVLKVLVGDFLGAYQEYSDRIAVLLLDYMLVMPRIRRVNRAVIAQAAKHVGFSVGLAHLVEDSDKGEDKKQTKDAAVNNALIAALAESFLASPKEQTALLRSALTSGTRSRPLVLMVLLRALATVKKSRARGLLEEAMPLLELEWSRATGLDTPDEDPLQDDVTAWAETGLPQGEEAVAWIRAVRASPERVSLTLLVKSFELAVRLMDKAKSGQTERVKLEALFLTLASAPKHLVKGIMPTVERIMDQVAGSGLSQRTEWLANRFIGKEVEPRVQERCLVLLSDSLQEKEMSISNLSSLLPKLLVALISSTKSVRKAALKAVQTAWVRSADLAKGEEMQSEEADVSDLRKVLDTAWGERRSFKADGAHLTSFLSELLSVRDDAMADDAEQSNLRAVFEPQRKWAVLSFLAGAVVERLDTSGQRAVLLGALRQPLVSLGSTEQSVSVKRLQPLALIVLKLEGGGVMNLDDVAFLTEFLGLFTPELASSLVLEGEEGPGPSLEPLILALPSGGVNADILDAVAVAAAERVDQQFFANLSPAAQDWVTAVLLALRSSTTTEALHKRVRRALEAIKLSPAAIGRLLTVLLDDPAAQNGAATPAKKKKKGQLVNVLSPVQKIMAGNLQVGTALLELLQWKQLSENAHVDALAQQLSVLLRRLIDCSWPPEQATDSTLMPRAVYAVQLALATLEQLAAPGEVTSVGRKTRGARKADGVAFDVDLVVRCIREAPDAPTRNHALALLAALAKSSPDEVLHHLLDVATILGASSLALDDSASHRVVQSMIAAVVPVYVAHSKDLDQLLGVFVTALPKVPEHRRLSLLEGLLRAVGAAGELHRVLLLLLREQVEGRGSDPEEGTSPRSVLVSETEDWLVRLADALANQYLPSVRLAAYHKLLEATTISDAPSAVSRKLSRAVTAFVVSQLSRRGFQGSDQAANTEEEGRKIQEGYVTLMEQVLLRLRPSAAKSGDAKSAKANTEAAYQLLEALYGLMDPAAYLSGISGLLHHQERHVRRRVLKLLASEVKDSSAEESPDTVAQYSSLASNVARLLDGPNADPSPSTKQAALSALEAIAQNFGARNPETFGASLGAVLSNVEGQSYAVMSAAVKCAASICASVGPRALPHLPKVLATILGCAHRQLVAEKALSARKEVPLSEDQSELLTVCVSAVATLVSELGAFLSPYLGEILDLVLLQPAVVTSAEAALTRALLPEKVPPRLLLDPLMKAYARALALGPRSEKALASLFELVASLASKLDKQAVAAHHWTVFDFLLTAFDLRRRPPAGVSSSAVGGSVEPVLIRAFVALVVKLSENTFKPLFLRTLEWAEKDYLPSDEGVSEMTRKGSLARNTFLYALVGELTERLRSVFVPYFKYLMEGIVSHLGGTAGQGSEGGEEENVGMRPKKKKKKSGTEGGAAEAARLTPQQWELRRLVVAALQKCFQYDTVGFLESGRFQKLLPPLVAQLRVEAPEDITDETLKTSADETLVSTLGHMALAARSDALWRPLNREVLMATRYSEETPGASRTRLLALSVVEFLADRLREEYLILLPETIPFLSELLEDGDLKVVAKSQEVVKKLEDLSGENLADYF